MCVKINVSGRRRLFEQTRQGAEEETSDDDEVKIEHQSKVTRI